MGSDAEILASPAGATFIPCEAPSQPGGGHRHRVRPSDIINTRGIIMTTQNLPGSDAARHGTGDADLTIMLAAHDAFRRDLTRLARTTSAANLSDPARRQSVAAGWDLFKRELYLHHTTEDELIWPTLRPRLAHSEAALSVLAAMEAEHELIDPLLAAVDSEFAGPGDRLADVIDALTSSLAGHLRHEERDGLPLIGVALTAAEWRGVGRKMASKNGLAASSQMFAWILDDTDREHAAATLAQLPPPLRLLYRAVWKPRFERTPRWLAFALADGRVHLGLAGRELGGVLLLDALGDVLVVAHQRLEVGAGRVQHSQLGECGLDLLAPQPDVPHARDDPAE